MLTVERVQTLLAVKAGRLRREYKPLKGGIGQERFAPKEHTVAAGFLVKAGLIQYNEYGEVTVTKRGDLVLSSIQP